MASSAKKRAVGLGENPEESGSSDENPEDDGDSEEEEDSDASEEINEVTGYGTNADLLAKLVSMHAS